MNWNQWWEGSGGSEGSQWGIIQGNGHGHWCVAGRGGGTQPADGSGGSPPKRGQNNPKNFCFAAAAAASLASTCLAKTLAEACVKEIARTRSKIANNDPFILFDEMEESELQYFSILILYTFCALAWWNYIYIIKDQILVTWIGIMLHKSYQYHYIRLYSKLSWQCRAIQIFCIKIFFLINLIFMYILINDSIS